MGAHLCLFGIIGICESNFDNFDCLFVDLVKGVGCMRDLIRLDV
jgi:hypothetical protein